MRGRSAARTADEQAGAERRWLTVLFCDLAGSTRLSVRLDPEDLQDVIRQVLDVAAGEIEAAGGFVARYMGDGVLAYFGYPSAQEDAAERAVGAADRIRGRVRTLRTAKTPHLAVRVGIASGLVVVGEMLGKGSAQERSVAGATPNLAARIQSCAKPDEVLVSDTVSQRAARRFSFEALPPRRLRGFPGAVPLFRLAGEGGAPVSRLSHTPLLGRDAERAWLLQRWQAAETGRGGVIGVRGPAGIGKSRLLQSLRDEAAGGRWIWTEATSTDETTPLHPFIAPVRRAILDDGTDGGPAGAKPPSPSPLLTGHAGLSSVEGAALSPAVRRRRLLRDLRDWLFAMGVDGPLGVVVEDLHWADPTTLDFLQALAPELAARRILLAVTSRETIPPDLVPADRTLTLDRLPDRDIAELVRGVGAATLPDETIRQLVSRADGVPLFAEELALEAGRGAGAGASEIPARLTDLLATRLDRLGELKPLVRAAATLGPDGPPELLAACAGLEPDRCETQVDRLVTAGILVRGEAGRVGFRHSLLRDAAYDAILRRERQGMHKRIVEALQARFAAFAAARPDWLARHAAAAGDHALAADAWGQAGANASDTRAYVEAERCYREGLAELPADARGRRPGLEMELRSGLVAALQVTRGYSAAETTRAMAEARKLARLGGDLREQFAQLSGSWTAASSGGEYGQARRLADRALDLARTEGSDALLGLAYMMQLTSRYRGGDLLGTEAAFENGAAHFASESFRRRPGAIAQAYGNAAVNAWLLGDRRAARRRSAHGLETSLRSGNPYEAAFALYMAAMADVLLGDLASGRGRAEEALRLSDSGGFPQFAATSRLVLGRALVGLAAPAEGLQLLDDGLEQMARITRSRAGLTMYLTWRGEAFAAFGDAPGALAAFDAALAANPEERFFRPETLRLKGEALLALGRADEATATLEAAEQLAAQFGAATLRGRAARSLRRSPRPADRSRRARR